MNIKETLKSIALKYPTALVDEQLKDIERIAFHIQLVLDRKGAQVTVCDLGGGVGLFSVGCAALGMKSILVDDFLDEINLNHGESVLDIHRSYGVEVVSSNVVKDGLSFAPRTLDVVTTFESMEHWHHSPKKLFKSVTTMLKPNGLFILGVPNCVNMRKRITVPFGHGKWSQMQDWYEPEIFRGHTREPDVDDLLYIAKDMGLKGVEIMGRNWSGYASPRKIIRLATSMTDTVLRLRPTLCSDIYMLGYTDDSPRS